MTCEEKADLLLQGWLIFPEINKALQRPFPSNKANWRGSLPNLLSYLHNATCCISAGNVQSPGMFEFLAAINPEAKDYGSGSQSVCNALGAYYHCRPTKGRVLYYGNRRVANKKKMHSSIEKLLVSLQNTD